MYTLRIKITKQLLEQSKDCQMKFDSCVFARAFRDFFPQAIVLNASIFPFGTKIPLYEMTAFNLKNLCESDEAMPTTQEISNYITLFDNTRPALIPLLPESEFNLPIPDWVIEKINIDELKPLLASHPNLSLVTI